MQMGRALIPSPNPCHCTQSIDVRNSEASHGDMQRNHRLDSTEKHEPRTGGPGDATVDQPPQDERGVAGRPTAGVVPNIRNDCRLRARQRGVDRLIDGQVRRPSACVLCFRRAVESFRQQRFIRCAQRKAHWKRRGQTAPCVFPKAATSVETRRTVACAVPSWESA